MFSSVMFSVYFTETNFRFFAKLLFTCLRLIFLPAQFFVFRMLWYVVDMYMNLRTQCLIELFENDRFDDFV